MDGASGSMAAPGRAIFPKADVPRP